MAAIGGSSLATKVVLFVMTCARYGYIRLTTGIHLVFPIPQPIIPDCQDAAEILLKDCSKMPITK